MTNPKVKVIFALAMVLAGCSPASRPETNLIGRWQSESTPKKTGFQPTNYQYQFFSDGSITYSEQTSGKWHQEAAGTFKFVDKNHVKIALAPAWYFGTKIHDLSWQDLDHITFRAGDTTMHLARQK